MKALLQKLYNANSEDELQKIVESSNDLSNPCNWKPYGNSYNNCATFENQQDTAEAALVEKLTNSTDALLMKECFIRNIKPNDTKDSRLPKTMTSAVEEFYSVRDGKWENATSSYRRSVAENLQLIVTGNKTTPNITIYDNGEGQNPDEFESTLLSLHKGNKTNIPFVQGKYNQGSTGAVVFCGKLKYQLIISRRNSKIINCNDKIGFTLVRRHKISEEEEGKVRTTWYEYFTLNDEIPSFSSNIIKLDLYNREFTYGTIIKLFSYQLSRGCRSTATLDLWRELNTLLYETPIPILIYENRAYTGHSKTKLLLGNKTRISLNENNKVRYPLLSYKLDIGYSVPVEVSIFEHGVNTSEFIRKKSVIYTLNGQTQGRDGQTFISSKLKLRNLKQNMLISVDCTNLNTEFRTDLFMSSRDRLRKGEYYDILENKLIEVLGSDEYLRKIDQEYKGRILHENKDDKTLIEEAFKTFKNDKSLRNLLANTSGQYELFANKKMQNSATNKKALNGRKHFKRYPSIFRLKNAKLEDNQLIKAIPKGSKSTLKFETDVTNDYFTRNIDAGNIEIKILDYGSSKKGINAHPPSLVKDIIKVQRVGPFNGEIKLIIEPNNNLNVGDKIELSINLLSSSGNLEVIVWVKIETENRGNSNKKKKELEPDLNLPQAVRVFQKRENAKDAIWSDFNMTAEDVVKLRLSSDCSIETVLINMDSNQLNKIISKQKGDAKRISSEYFSSIYSHVLIIYITLLSYYSSESQKNENYSNYDEIKDNLDSAVSEIFKYYGNFIMTYSNK